MILNHFIFVIWDCTEVDFDFDTKIYCCTEAQMHLPKALHGLISAAGPEKVEI